MSASPPTFAPGPPAPGTVGRAFALTGGLLFVLSLLYFPIAYRQFGAQVGAWSSTAWLATTVDVALFSIFALHHSVFARVGLKARINALVGTALERSVYVWLSSLLFLLTLWAWMPVPGVAWHVEGPARWLLWSGCLSGVVLTAFAAAAIDPLELAGIRQAFGRPLNPTISLSTTGLYGIVRHPIYLGWILMVWCMPVMTTTRLVFAFISTVYLFVAIPFEERAMRESTGPAYDDYSLAVRWRVLPGLY